MEDSNKKERENLESQPSQDKPEQKPAKDISRRNALKAFAGIPVAGIFGYELFKKINHDTGKSDRITLELGLDKMEFPIPDYGKRVPRYSSGRHNRIRASR